MTNPNLPAPPTEVLHALERFAASLDAIRFLPGTAASGAWEERRQWCRRLFLGKLRLEALGRRSPLKLVVAGGTNVGKSTLFNRILDAAVSGTSPLARFTKSAVLYAHADVMDETVPAEFLPGYPRQVFGDSAATDAAPVGGSAPGETVADRPTLHCRLHRRDPYRDLHLLDSPDIDSNYSRNLSTAEDMFFLADGVLFVTTPEKYNDEICVHYMRRAVQYKKRLWILLNKCTSAEVGLDLRDEIVAGIAKDGGSAEHVSVREVPFLRNPGREEGPWLEAIRAIPQEALGDREAKGRAYQGALEHLETDVKAVLDQVQLEQAYLDGFRSELGRLHVEAVAVYRDFLSGLDFTELDEVYKRVLREFRVPVLDDMYDALGSVTRKLFSGMRRLTGAPPKSAVDRKIEERRHYDRERVKSLFQKFHHGVVQLAERAPADLSPVVRSWVPPQAPVEELNLLVQTFQTATDDVTQRWVETEKGRVLETLRNKPGTKQALKAARGVLQLGFGMLSMYFTGGLNVTDLVIGPLSERAMKYLLDSTGGAKFYLDLRAKFLDDRADMFRRFLDRRIADAVRVRMPEPVPATVRGELLAALETLRSVDLKGAEAPPRELVVERP